MIDTPQLIPYKVMPNWTATTIPETFLNRHNTKVGTWGKLTILKGALDYFALDDEGQVIEVVRFDEHSDIPFVEPQAWHRVAAASDDLEFYLTFYCQKEDYVAKKYGLTKTHSEVIEAAPYLTAKSKVLDLGSGQGRNALYLSLLGHNVTAVDANGQSLVRLENIALEENLPVKIDWYDINQAAIKDDYDLILSTVVFMFLDADNISAIIQNMKDHTNLGGYNLIVCAMDTDDYPCPMPFSFTFKENELKNYYHDWELIKYDENVGELHRRDQDGNHIKMRFATMLAKKV